MAMPASEPVPITKDHIFTGHYRTPVRREAYGYRQLGQTPIGDFSVKLEKPLGGRDLYLYSTRYDLTTIEVYP